MKANNIKVGDTVLEKRTKDKWVVADIQSGTSDFGTIIIANSADLTKLKRCIRAAFSQLYTKIKIK